MELIKYDAACRAVAECRSIDEALAFRNRSEALRAYAKQAKNRQLEIDACEIRVRAERKTGEILLSMTAASKLARQGHSDETVSRDGLVRRSELGLDGNLSSIAQRLAKLPAPRFEAEMSDWRRSALHTERLTTPLQRYRVPSLKADRQREAARGGRHRIDQADPFDAFRNIDGRRIADWRSGELVRLEEIGRRITKCAATLREELPVANSDPLETMEMLFEKAKLLSILQAIWTEIKLPQGDAGLNAEAQRERTQASLEKRSKKCSCCGKDFVMRRAPRASRPYEGQFCSRSCAGKRAGSNDGRDQR